MKTVLIAAALVMFGGLAWASNLTGPEGGWMNKTLTSISNMFTNLDITDMETCYKLFRREIIQGIDLKEDRFGFEPEVTTKITQTRSRFYECAISYTPRTSD